MLTRSLRISGAHSPFPMDLIEPIPHKLEDVMRLKTPSLIFVNSMSDFFLADAEFNLEAGTLDVRRDEVLDPMEQTLHQYQALTKRLEEMLRYSRRRKLPANFWAGVSVDVQHFASRIEVLRQEFLMGGNDKPMVLNPLKVRKLIR